MVSGGTNLPTGLKQGYYVSPTVFANVRDEMKIAREEIFGPVISVFRFDDEDEVIARANSLHYGLGGGVWTSRLDVAHRVSQGLNTGSVWVNCYQQVDTAVPFGGYKMSGYGKEGGVGSIANFLNSKSVSIKLT